MQNKIKAWVKKWSGSGSQERPETQSHHDPVCGMKATSDFFSVQYNGNTYYFCSDYCKQQFEATPANYVS